jgi:hypothetical protein
LECGDASPLWILPYLAKAIKGMESGDASPHSKENAESDLPLVEPIARRSLGYVRD